MSKAKQRVVITGMGCCAANGRTIDDAWRAVNTGETGIAPITQWDASKWKHPLGAEIKDYNPRNMIADRKLLKLISRQDVIGLNAADQAIVDGGLLTHRESLSEKDTEYFNDRTGVFVASPGNHFRQQYDFMSLFEHAQGDMKKFGEALFEHIHPMWLLKILPNNVIAYVGIQNGFKGFNENITNHAAGGLQAISEAARFIKHGYMDRAVVVSYDSAVEPQGQIYYGCMGLLSHDGLRPFDKCHNGTILAEGAGAIVVESLESAQQRGANIYGEILGDATTSEAQGVFAMRDDGDGLTRCLRGALDHSNLSADDIGMITTHGNGTVKSDTTESMAIRNVFGDETVPVTGYKWSFGHTLNAAGVLDTMMTVLSLSDGKVPGIANLREISPDCKGIAISSDSQDIDKPHAAVISRAFGSISSALIVSKYQ